MGIGTLEAVTEEGSSPPDPLRVPHETVASRRMVALMQEKLKRQSRVTLGWKMKYKEETRLTARLSKERDDNLRTIQRQLSWFESMLRRGRADLTVCVSRKDAIIRTQHQLICRLTLALLKRGGHEDLRRILPGLRVQKSSTEKEETEKKNDQTIKEKKDVEESLNDSDSAIMMEDAFDSLVSVPLDSEDEAKDGRSEIKVMRSVSDALEILSRGAVTSSTNATTRRPNGSLSSSPSHSSDDDDERNIHLTSTPHSSCLSANDMLGDDISLSSVSSSSSTAKMDSDSDATLSDGCNEDDNLAENVNLTEGSLLPQHRLMPQLMSQPQRLSHCSSGVYNRLNAPENTLKKRDDLIQVTYNRVMSNHRSVTKPKDVKYRRINKAKSRSLEELRVKLKSSQDPNLQTCKEENKTDHGLLLLHCEPEFKSKEMKYLQKHNNQLSNIHDYRKNILYNLPHSMTRDVGQSEA